MNVSGLAAAVKERRAALGLPTMAVLAQEAGLTTRVISDIENARRSNYSQQTLLALDNALRWVNGSSYALLHKSVSPQELPAQARNEESTRLDDRAKLATIANLLGVGADEITGLSDLEVRVILRSLTASLSKDAYEYTRMNAHR